MAAFIYVAGAALRLARFNTQIDIVDKKFFIGLSSPMAAAVVAGFIWVAVDYGLSAQTWAAPLAVLVASMGVLMVSNIKYNSFKEVDFKGRVPFVVLLAIILGFAVVAVDPALVLFVIAFLYALSGPVMYLRRRSVKPAEAEDIFPMDDVESTESDAPVADASEEAEK